jgi:hypothetical protein
VGYIPNTSAHYLENTGEEDLVYVGRYHLSKWLVCVYLLSLANEV